MRSLSLIICGLLAAETVHAAPSARKPLDTSLTDRLATQARSNVAKYFTAKGYPKQNCTVETALVRKEWGSLSAADRKDYIAAVQCLSKKPARYNATIAPGAKTRYDDFVANHIIQTPWIHGTGNFLSWHRYFIFAFEKALKEECGMKINLPYWNWGRWSDDPLTSPIFDGSDTSLSGNGAYRPHDNTFFPGMSSTPGTGGDCLTSGPFVNFTVNLGPAISFLTLNGTSYVSANPRPDGLGYNPRCIRRDINPGSAKWTQDNETAWLVGNNSDPYWFQTNMEGDIMHGHFGIHGGGHYTVAGDPGGDPFTSPGDPVFWLHHGQIDRVWWMWQSQDLETRYHAPTTSLTITGMNMPPSRNATIDDLIDIGPSGDPFKIREFSNTLGGPLCYIYE